MDERRRVRDDERRRKDEGKGERRVLSRGSQVRMSHDGVEASGEVQDVPSGKPGGPEVRCPRGGHTNWDAGCCGSCMKVWCVSCREKKAPSPSGKVKRCAEKVCVKDEEVVFVQVRASMCVCACERGCGSCGGGAESVKIVWKGQMSEWEAKSEERSQVQGEAGCGECVKVWEVWWRCGKCVKM